MIALLGLKASSQNKYATPKGFKIYKDYNGQPIGLDNDFDNDGITDRAIVLTESASNTNVVAVFLSTSYFTRNTISYLPFDAESYSISLQNKVLSVGACLGTGRFCKTFKFKYYVASKGMRLIGYDEESFGNAAHDGAYLKTVNLLTNKFELSGPKWKTKLVKHTKLPIMTLESLEPASLDDLERIGEVYISN
jgi:hypothetical protein